MTTKYKAITEKQFEDVLIHGRNSVYDFKGLPDAIPVELVREKLKKLKSKKIGYRNDGAIHVLLNHGAIHVLENLLKKAEVE